MRISGYYDLGGKKAPVTRLRVSSGDDRDILIRCLDEDGAVVDITGATPIEFRVAKANNSGDEILKDLDDGVVITDASNGEFTVSLVPTDTDEFEDNYIWSAQVTLSGKLRTVARGDFVVQPGVGDA